MNNPTHDPEALYAARYAIRQAYAAIQRLRQADPTIRVLLTQLDEMACELTTELDAVEPELPLSVRHPVLDEAQMRVAGGMAGLEVG